MRIIHSHLFTVMMVSMIDALKVTVNHKNARRSFWHSDKTDSTRHTARGIRDAGRGGGGWADNRRRMIMSRLIESLHGDSSGVRSDRLSDTSPPSMAAMRNLVKF